MSISYIIIDKETTLSDIDAYIANATNIDNELNTKHNAIKARVKSELENKIQSLLNDANGIGSSEAFLKELQTAIAVCVGEMHEERNGKDGASGHNANIKNHEPWENALMRVPGRWFGTNKEEAEALSSSIKYHIEETRESIRKQYAIYVYGDLKMHIDTWLKKIQLLKDKMVKLQGLMSNWKLKKESEASSISPFRVNLHADDVKKDRVPDPNDSMLFVQSFKGSVANLFSAKDEEEIFQRIKPWADHHKDVRDAFACGVEDKLKSMNPDEVNNVLNHIKKCASPMWSVDFQGKLKDPKGLIDIFIVGCEDGLNNIIRNDATLSNVFMSTDGKVSPSFVSTYQKDRIQFLTLSCCAPVYAVKNTTAYRDEFEKHNPYQSGYIDQNWNQRMISENFSLIPQRKNNGPNPLEIWVKAVALGLLKYDNNQYWVKSRLRGIALKGFRLDLGATRDVAYQAYMNMNIHKEMLDEINSQINTLGSDAIQSKFDAVTEDNYLDKSMISDDDKMHLNDNSHYQQLIDLMTEEITFVSNGGLKVKA